MSSDDNDANVIPIYDQKNVCGHIKIAELFVSVLFFSKIRGQMSSTRMYTLKCLASFTDLRFHESLKELEALKSLCRSPWSLWILNNGHRWIHDKIVFWWWWCVCRSYFTKHSCCLQLSLSITVLSVENVIENLQILRKLLKIDYEGQ